MALGPPAPAPGDRRGWRPPRSLGIGMLGWCVSPIELIVQAVTNTEAALFAFLFGSRASGHARPDSDWDVAVYLREDLTPRERFDVRLRLLADLDGLGAVDVVVLNDAPPLLAHRALLGRRLLMRDETAFVRFFVRTMAMVEDMEYWAGIHLKARLRRLREGRFGRRRRL